MGPAVVVGGSASGDRTVDTHHPAPLPMPSRPPPGRLKKEGEGYVLHTDVEEVILNATVLEGNRLVPDLTKDDFQSF